jgi:hypothetical protein
MRPFEHQLIHDESNTSVEFTNSEITKQLQITVGEFTRKRKILLDLVKQGKFSHPRFVNVQLLTDPDSISKVEVLLWTKDSAGLTVTLSKYGNTKGYLGIRGSPSRLLDGQNVVETIDENERVQEMMKRLKCNAFGARTVIGFFMIHSFVKAVAGVEFFTKEEQRKVWKRDIGIYSVGYADYVKIENRDKYWPFLAFVCTTQINVEGKHTGLMEGYLGVRAVCWNDKISYTAVTKDWGKVRKKGLPIGDTTGLLLKKQIGKANGYGCLMYLKDHEVRAKAKGVFTLNSVKVAELGSQAKGEFESQLIRMDNVFQHNYIREWVNIRRRQLGLQSVIRVTVANAEDLFDDRNIIKNMISQMRNDLGIRIVLGAPSLERIEKLKKDPLIEDKGLKDAVVKLVSYWTTLDSRWDGSRFEWDSALDFKKLGVPRSTLRVAYQWLVSREYLDVDLPYDFYVNLNQVRTEYFKTVTDNRVISMFLLNFKDPNRNDPDIEEVKARLLKQSRLMTKEMRLKVVPPPPRTKQAILKNMVT